MNYRVVETALPFYNANDIASSSIEAKDWRKYFPLDIVPEADLSPEQTAFLLKSGAIVQVA